MVSLGFTQREGELIAEEMVGKPYPYVTTKEGDGIHMGLLAWDCFNIQAALTAIDPNLTLQPHGDDYLVSGVPREGMFPYLPWRTGHVMYGYYNTPTPTGWFFTPQYCLHQHLMERP